MSEAAAPSGARVGLLSSARPLGRAARVGLAGSAFLAAVAFHVPLCIFAIVTHEPCPGCGLTRATIALLSGHLREAIALHPLAPVMGPIAVAAMTFNAVSYVARGRWLAAEAMQARWVTVAGAVLAVALMAVWIARFLGAFGGPVAV